jgi:hypothetical protein
VSKSKRRPEELFCTAGRSCGLLQALPICTQPQASCPGGLPVLLRIRDYFRRAYSRHAGLAASELNASEPGKRVFGLLRVCGLLLAALPLDMKLPCPHEEQRPGTHCPHGDL